MLKTQYMHICLSYLLSFKKPRLNL
uniref:Uncharacterized protein n=1 Tax=Anguilla anguilla TaxID=7936 RepID=A0A0E9T3B9_ANGAN